jgi:NTP pyrophosphatase (non-canonical NTP hydrolase)
MNDEDNEGTSGGVLCKRGADRVRSYTTPLTCSGGRREILREVSIERDAQDAKWGGVPGLERRDDHSYAAVLGEEFGEVCKAWLERDREALREELLHTAAVAVAWIEEMDNASAER